MAEINGEEKRIGVSGEQIEEVVVKMPAVEADVKANKQSISALQADVSKHTEDIAKNTADIALKANADEVYSKDETDSAITAKVAEIVAGAPEEFDTLKEMSDWLTEHSDSAATMNTAIQANTKAIADNATAIEGNTADIEQNKSDILSLYKNSHNRGVASAKNNSNKWYKIGEYTSSVSLNATLLITSRYLDIQGLLTLTANVSSSSSGLVWGSTALKANWLGLRTITDNRSKYNITEMFKFGGTLTDGNLHCELWVKMPISWDVLSATILSPNQNMDYSWEILNSETAFDNYPEFEKISSPVDMLFDFETRIKTLEAAAGITTVSE
jgi:hypothetical protein